MNGSSRRGMGSHQSSRMQTDVWLTPPSILAALGPFDLDPCAAPEPRPWATARRHIALPDDGLTAEWRGRVWLNPPYSSQAVVWMRRLAAHAHGTALVFARTETSWFVDSVWRAATGLLFLHGRVTFLRPDGSSASDNAGAPSVLVAYGKADADILRGCNLDGTYVEVPPGSRRPVEAVNYQPYLFGAVLR